MIYDESLLKELQDYMNRAKRRLIVLKSLTVYNKCLLHGRSSIAEKIREKYAWMWPHDDSFIALSLTLQQKYDEL